MNVHESILLNAYSRLLADLADNTKEPLIEAHWCMSESWVTNIAPKLDKYMLQLLETYVPTDDLNEGPHLSDQFMAEQVVSVMIKSYGKDVVLASPSWEAAPDHFEDIFLWLLDTFKAYIRGENVLERIEVMHKSLLFCYKAEYEPTKQQLEEAYGRFEQTDVEVGKRAQALTGYWERSNVLLESRRLVSRIICKANWNEIAPKHGPGAVFPPRKPSAKSEFTTYYRSIDEVYPYTDWIRAVPCYWHGRGLECTFTAEPATIECRITAVPKDSRGPRIICVHPTEAVWIQQGVRHVLENAINTSPLTRGSINFSDQTINGNKALQASRSREFVTLDLKDASDLVSVELVRFLFGDYVYRFFDCCRATHVHIGERLLKLRKFAPMGNALTFPVESLVFWALVRACIHTHYGENCDDVYVFGDDLIYPQRYHERVVEVLRHAGLTVNTSKTFVRGFFRESCGVDAWNGTDITPLRMKVRSVNSCSEAVSFCDLARRASVRGNHRLATYLYTQIESWLGRKLAYTNNPNTQGLVRYVDVDLGKLMSLEGKLRFNQDYHRWEIPSYLLIQGTIHLETHDWYHVQDSLMHLWRRYDACAYQPLVLGTREGHPHQSVDDDGNVVTCCQSEADRLAKVAAQADKTFGDPGIDYSDRGLEYPDPHRARLARVWTEVLCK